MPCHTLRRLMLLRYAIRAIDTIFSRRHAPFLPRRHAGYALLMRYIRCLLPPPICCCRRASAHGVAITFLDDAGLRDAMPRHDAG